MAAAFDGPPRAHGTTTRTPTHSVWALGVGEGCPLCSPAMGSISEWLDPREWALAMCGSDAKSRHGDVGEQVPMVERRDENERRARIADLQAEVRALREQLSVAQEAREHAEAKARQHMSLRRAVADLVPAAAARMNADASLSTDELLELVRVHLREKAGEGGSGYAGEKVQSAEVVTERSESESEVEHRRLAGVCAVQQAELANVKQAAEKALSRSASLQSMLDGATLRATRAEAAANEATHRASIAVAEAEANFAAQAAHVEGLFATAIAAARRELSGAAAEQARLAQHQVSGLIRVAKLAQLQNGATAGRSLSTPAGGSSTVSVG